ncbi:MAG TPA: ABC transporter ATP-binding protein [Sphingomonadaceae bacterium]
MALLVVLTMASSGVGLFVPQVIATAIDAFTAGKLDLRTSLVELTALALGSFLLGIAQAIVQAVASERVARDLRSRLAEKVSQQSYSSVIHLTPAKLLTNFTADVDSIKNFVSQAVASLVSSVFIIIAASALLLWLNWRLALAVLAILPLIGVTFFVVMGRVRKLFLQIMSITDSLNRVLNENIVGAALVRLLDSGRREFSRFLEVNEQARALGLRILNHFASMIPIITFLANLATLTILALGGHFVIVGEMSIGEFSAFNSYLAILIFPIIVIGFTSMMISQAQASYGRIGGVLNAPPTPQRGEVNVQLEGTIAVRNLSLAYDATKVLEDISFEIAPRSRTAIVGPTAAGKSQLLYMMAGLLAPTGGQVLYDGRPIDDYGRDSFYGQVGFVFQDSKLFNLTLRENIAFRTDVPDASLARAIETAELQNFIASLPEGLDTVVSERGLSLSGGQRQRIMLARALALDPRVLFLDDFTARVDLITEARILTNVRNNYPDLTLISITQKIAPVEDYDQIILLMEGEIVAKGTHRELVHGCPEYVQIQQSQQSTDKVEAA